MVAWPLRRQQSSCLAWVIETPNRALTIAYNADGFSWKPRQLAPAVERHNERLAKADKVRLGLSLHGLRHSRDVKFAEAGASGAEIMS